MFVGHPLLCNQAISETSFQEAALSLTQNNFFVLCGKKLRLRRCGCYKFYADPYRCILSDAL